MSDEEPLFRPWMEDARIWQVAICDLFHSAPWQSMLLTSASDGAEPTIDYVMPKRCDRRRTHWHRVIREPATQDLAEPYALSLYAIMASCSKMFLYLPQRRSHPFAHRCPSKHEIAAASPGRAVMRESEKIERLRLPKASSLTACYSKRVAATNSMSGGRRAGCYSDQVYRGRASGFQGAEPTGLCKLHLSGRKLVEAAPGDRQGRMASGRTLSTRRLHRYQHVETGRECRRFLQQARDVREVDQGRQGRGQMDTAVMPRVRGQCGSPSASHARLQSRQLPAHAGDARADQRLVADQPEGEADQDRCEGRQPWALCRIPDGRGRHLTTFIR